MFSSYRDAEGEYMNCKQRMCDGAPWCIVVQSRHAAVGARTLRTPPSDLPRRRSVDFVSLSSTPVRLGKLRYGPQRRRRWAGLSAVTVYMTQPICGHEYSYEHAFTQFCCGKMEYGRVSRIMSRKLNETILVYDSVQKKQDTSYAEAEARNDTAKKTTTNRQTKTA